MPLGHLFFYYISYVKMKALYRINDSLLKYRKSMFKHPNPLINLEKK